ncbi:MAG: class I SAM-dependent methyltransferase [Clostridiales bacterium]|nr:class I SAM-dependent methyltransferase [Clostridiales bacterium]
MTHYFDPEPEAEHRYRHFTAEFGGEVFAFCTDSGVFSADGIDRGTALLIETVLAFEPATAGEGERFLDLGCGFGAVAVVFSKLRPGFEIVASDVNRRALELTQCNLRLNNVTDALIVESDGFESLVGSFDLILQNPPIRCGKQTVYRLCKKSYSAPNPGGRMYIVNRKQQGAASSVTELCQYFAEVEIIKKKSGYWIICCAKQ